jgi:hypothetical protein
LFSCFGYCDVCRRELVLLYRGDSFFQLYHGHASRASHVRSWGGAFPFCGQPHVNLCSSGDERVSSYDLLLLYAWDFPYAWNFPYELDFLYAWVFLL